jgi:hypothetical protein
MTLGDDAGLVDVAFAACTVLARAGETAVLCGGSAAAYYVPDRYQSLDIDFVVEVGAAPHIVDRALSTIGYTFAFEGHYRHDRLPYTLAFPIGPLSIGRDYITTWRTEHRADSLLHVYTPTDVVRDRFLHFWAWGDRTALEVALAVARVRAPDVDTAALHAWVDREIRADASYDASRVARFFALLREPER